MIGKKARCSCGAVVLLVLEAVLEAELALPPLDMPEELSPVLVSPPLPVVAEQVDALDDLDELELIDDEVDEEIVSSGPIGRPGKPKRVKERPTSTTPSTTDRPAQALGPELSTSASSTSASKPRKKRPRNSRPDSRQVRPEVPSQPSSSQRPKRKAKANNDAAQEDSSASSASDSRTPSGASLATTTEGQGTQAKPKPKKSKPSSGPREKSAGRRKPRSSTNAGRPARSVKPKPVAVEQSSPFPVETVPIKTMERPLVSDAFDDLDAILEGGVDVSPLKPKTRSDPETRPQPGSVDAPKPAGRPASANAGPNAAGTSTAFESKDRSNAFAGETGESNLVAMFSMIGGLAGILFGVVCFVSRFQSFGDSILGYLFDPIYGLNQGTIGTTIPDDAFQTAFVVQGWVLLLIGIVAAMTGVLLAIRGLTLLAKTELLRWAHVAGVIVSVLGVGMILVVLITQYAYFDSLNANLDEIAAGGDGLIQDLENTRLLRDDYLVAKQALSLALIILVTMPLMMAVGSLVGLFCGPARKQT